MRLLYWIVPLLLACQLAGLPARGNEAQPIRSAQAFNPVATIFDAGQLEVASTAGENDEGTPVRSVQAEFDDLVFTPALHPGCPLPRSAETALRLSFMPLVYRPPTLSRSQAHYQSGSSSRGPPHFC